MRMVPRRGFEPLAFPLGGGRSIQLSYRGWVVLPARDYINKVAQDICFLRPLERLSDLC